MALIIRSSIKKNRGIKINKIDKKQFFNNLVKIGYSKKSFNHFDEGKYLIFLVKAFQRRYRQELISGKIDKECLLISKNLINKNKKF